MEASGPGMVYEAKTYIFARVQSEWLRFNKTQNAVYFELNRRNFEMSFQNLMITAVHCFIQLNL